jgi:predicted amidohydrolase
VRLAIIQMARGTKPEENLERMRGLCRQARGADAVLLPENWLGPFFVPEEFYLSALNEVAARLGPGCLLVGGAQYVRRGTQGYSRGYFIRSGEAPLAWYEKRFPSRPVGEREYLLPGGKGGAAELGSWRIGVLVCVDLLYPELARALALEGCRLLLNPVSVPRERQTFWQALGMIRAAENTVYVAVANNTASAYADGRRITGGSFVASPDGRLAAWAGSEETVLRVELDLEAVSRVRERWPYLEDARRLGLQAAKGRRGRAGQK